jgi:hypothetical protein
VLVLSLVAVLPFVLKAHSSRPKQRDVMETRERPRTRITPRPYKVHADSSGVGGRTVAACVHTH